MTALLNSGKKIDGVWTSGVDYTVVNAYRTAHRKLVPVVGADNNEFVHQLVTLKNNYKLLHPSETFRGTVILHADKHVDFKIIKKVMYTCAVAGYTNVNFAVNERSKGGGGG